MSESPRAMARSKAVSAAKPGAPVPRRHILAPAAASIRTTSVCPPNQGKHQSAEAICCRVIQGNAMLDQPFDHFGSRIAVGMRIAGHLCYRLCRPNVVPMETAEPSD